MNSNKFYFFPQDMETISIGLQVTREEAERFKKLTDSKDVTKLNLGELEETTFFYRFTGSRMEVGSMIFNYWKEIFDIKNKGLFTPKYIVMPDASFRAPWHMKYGEYLDTLAPWSVYIKHSVADVITDRFLGQSTIAKALESGSQSEENLAKDYGAEMVQEVKTLLACIKKRQAEKAL